MTVTQPARGGQDLLALEPGAGVVEAEEEEEIVLYGEELQGLEEEVDRGQVGQGPVNLPRQKSAFVAIVRTTWRLRVHVLVHIVQQDVQFVQSRDFSSTTLRLFALERAAM